MPTFQEFVELCLEADNLVRDLVKNSVSLQGRKPSNLRAAAVWYLARAKGFNVTLHHLYGVYGLRQGTLIKLRKLIEARGGENVKEEKKEKKRGKYLVITAELVPESEGVERSRLEKEIREEVEKTTIPWVKEILKVTISDYLFQDC